MFYYKYAHSSKIRYTVIHNYPCIVVVGSEHVKKKILVLNLDYPGNYWYDRGQVCGPRNIGKHAEGSG